jgi:hypothetical protein
MADFPNLPGTYVDLTDGNLQIVEVNVAPVVAVLGTAAQGTADALYPVVRPADASNAFGSSGTLIRGMYEVRSGGSQQAVLMRIGAKSAKLLHVGDDAGALGITIETFEKDDEAGEDLYIWWSQVEERLVVTDEDDSVVYEQLKAEVLTDLGACFTSGSAEAAGTDIGTESVPIRMDLVAVTGSRFIGGTDGVDGTAMDLYEALHKAYASLEASQLDIVVPMDVYHDTPNIADDSAIAVDYGMPDEIALGAETTLDLDHQRVNPESLLVMKDDAGNGIFAAYDYIFNRGAGTNDVDQLEFLVALSTDDVVKVTYNYLTTDGLLYFRTWEESGETMFQWYHEKYYYDADNDVTMEMHEANFAWQLAEFCYNLTKNDNDAIGVIGVRPFRSTALKDLANWAGYLPTYDANGAVTANGDGLAGNRWMAGKLMDVWSYAEEDDDELTVTATDTFDLAHGDAGDVAVVAGSVKCTVDSVVVTEFTISHGTGTLNVDQIIFEEALSGGEDIVCTYWYSTGVLTSQRGPGFNATTDDTYADGTPLSPNVDIGRYISVIMAWPILFTPVDATGFGYIATGAPTYGGFVSQLAPASAPTNKVIPGISSAFRLSKSRMDDLVSVHYVVFTPRERGTVCVDAPTAAGLNSDYQRLTTVRIVAETIKRLREVLNPFLGEGITTPQLNAMQTTTDRVLTDLIKDGLLQRAEASVSASAVEKVQGKANLDLLLVPAFELRQIYMTVSLSAI